jgi:hypothetical protein
MTILMALTDKPSKHQTPTCVSFRAASLFQWSDWREKEPTGLEPRSLSPLLFEREQTDNPVFNLTRFKKIKALWVKASVTLYSGDLSTEELEQHHLLLEQFQQRFSHVTFCELEAPEPTEEDKAKLDKVLATRSQKQLNQQLPKSPCFLSAKVRM